MKPADVGTVYVGTDVVVAVIVVVSVTNVVVSVILGTHQRLLSMTESS